MRLGVANILSHFAESVHANILYAELVMANGCYKNLHVSFQHLPGKEFPGLTFFNCSKGLYTLTAVSSCVADPLWERAIV